MGKQVNQGTRWESRIVSQAQAAGRNAMRLPKTGKKNEPDVFIAGKNRRPMVAWEKWIGKKGKGRRRARRMIILTEEHFKELLALDTEARYGYFVQAKSTQAGSINNWIEGLIERLREDGDSTHK